jgi:hypothetical protein
MTYDKTIELLKVLREAELLLDARSDAGAFDDARRIVTEVRAELEATDSLTATISLAWMFVDRLEKRIGWATGRIARR